jgi:hypothetical protein
MARMLLEWISHSPGISAVKTIHTILREDFGPLDPNLVRTELLGERGIHDVAHGPARNCLRIEYDPNVLGARSLADVLCRHGVYPNPKGADE